jgi:hypothetical protein
MASPSASKQVLEQLDGNLIMTDFDRNVQLLSEMGIDAELAEWALIEKANDVAEAVELSTNLSPDDLKKYSYHLVSKKSRTQLKPVSIQQGRASLEHALDSQMPGTPTPTRQLKPSQRANSEDMVQHWLRRGKTHPFPPEYQRANDQICIQPFLMAKTVLHKKLEELNRIAAAKPLQSGDTFTYSLTTAIRRAYKLSSDGAARRYFIQGRHDAAVEFQGYPFQESQLYVSSLPAWQQRYMHIAMREFIETEDAMGLQLIIGLLMRGARECDARKRWVFSTLIRRVGSGKGEIGQGPACSVDDVTARAVLSEQKTPESFFGFMKSVLFPTEPAPPPVLVPKTPVRADSLTPESKPIEPSPAMTLASAKERLYEKLEEMIDDIKERAFKTVFLEPTACYFHAIHDGINEGDVDVHGSNTYAAVLLASLGIRLARWTFMHDEAKGIANFLDSGIENTLRESLWKNENFGKGWSSCKQTREFGENSGRGQLHPVQTNEFLFGGAAYGHQAWQVGNTSVDPSAAMSNQRNKLARYLEQYTYYFREDVILQRLYSDLSQDASDKASLDVVFNEGVKGLHPEWVPDMEIDDVNFWIWNEDDYSFEVKRARRLFALLGIAKPPSD